MSASDKTLLDKMSLDKRTWNHFFNDFHRCRTKYSVELPPPGEYATGLFFLEKCETKRLETQQKFEAAASQLGLTVLCWRDVPVDNNTLGESALRSEPAILQVTLRVAGFFVVQYTKTQKIYQRTQYT
jgi:glutamate synthase domain-containing protein 1